MKIKILLFLILISLGPFKVLAVTDCAQVTQIPQVECKALIALYNSTNGLEWRKNDGWNVTNTPCSWHGVSCNGGYVQGLDLGGNGLTGLIPAELGNLSNLQQLSLYSNYLTGLISAELGNLINLQGLDLAGNELTGLIPAELGNLINLQDLDLGDNQLTGSIPAELGNLINLQVLYLGSNQLTGSIPAELGNMSNLQDIYLLENQLTGSIPAELGNLNLHGIYLFRNQLTGSIPAELGNLSKLQDLYLFSNKLTGSIPAELGNMSNLLDLDLGDNQLTGSIPAELGNLGNLRQLGLGDNQLCGSIPLSLMNLNNLFILSLQNNGLGVTDLDPQLEAFLNGLSEAIWKPQDPSICPTLSATLATFEAISNSKKVLLKWQTLVEDKNAGYFIWRGQPNNSQCTSNPENYHDIVLIGFEASKGNSFFGTTYLYQDHTVKPKTTYCYLLENRDFGGNRTFHWDSIIPVTTD